MIPLGAWWRMHSVGRARFILACLVGGAALGCESAVELPEAVCTKEIRPAVRVRVFDSLTGAPLTGSTSLTLREGGFVDSMMTPSHATTNYLLGTHASHERAGTYVVRVQRAGHADWERTGVEVTGDVCHVQTVELDALLQPLVP